jgi:outer membrane usher protein
MDAGTKLCTWLVSTAALALTSAAALAQAPAGQAFDAQLDVRAQVQAGTPPKLQAIEAWSAVRINQVEREEPVLVYRDDLGRIFGRASDIASWNLPFASLGETQLHRGEKLVRIAGRPGLDVDFDADAQVLELRVDPWLLPEQSNGGLRKAGQDLSPGDLALFGNYQVYAVEGIQDSFSGIFEIGSSYGRSSFASEWVGAEYGGVHRLDTALRIDMPERRARVVLGDAIGAAGIGGRGWRYGGVQWTTDLDLAPQLPTFALPAAKGIATVPSTVDLYVNGALTGSRQVEAGPFTIPDIAVPSGSGTVMLRVRDVLGREQYIEQRFLTTPLLLPDGLTTHSLEVGYLREDYGIEDFNYGKPFAAASLRRGINNSLTLETQVESGRGQSAARVAASTRIGTQVVAKLGGAMSRGAGVTGDAFDLSLDWQSRFVTISGQGRLLDDGYADLSTPLLPGRPDLEWSAQVAPRLPFAGSAGVAFTQRRGGDASRDVSIATAFASLARVFGGSVSLQVSRVSAERDSTQAGISYVRSLNKGRSTSLNFTRDALGDNLDWQISRTAPRDAGWGWQLGARRGSTDRYTARMDANTPYGRGEVEALRANGRLDGSASWTGGWVWDSGHVDATQPLSAAIAVVETPGLAGVRVYHDGQELGRTDRNGRLVATTLRPYETNLLKLDSSDIPVGAWVDDDDASVAPYTRGVVRVRFETEAASRSFSLQLADGSYVPAGASVTMKGRKYPVGDGGRVSLPLPEGVHALRASWDDRACEAALAADAGLRELVCATVAP